MSVSPAPATAHAHSAFYDDARAYDVAFSYRDVEAELSFLTLVAEKFGQGPIKSVLELASGPGYHAVAAAQRGLKATALDLSGPMIERALVKAKAANVDVTGVVADMARFTLKEPVDLAFNLLTSISYLLTSEDLHAHFQSVAKAVRPGGVYVVENNHANDFWTRDHFQPSRWTMKQDGVEVFTSWIDEPPVIDIVKQTYSVVARTEVTDAAGKRTLVDKATLRMVWPQELKAYGEAHGFKLASFYGALDVNLSIDDPKAWRTVAVMVRDQPQANQLR
ncbi:MAG: class I SAM-dependent methyltransferase [Deltaproteobacteria bacterium]|nr:class I SAM-dependent methyltransferase [Deltaproteobacteria bacterium]